MTQHGKQSGRESSPARGSHARPDRTIPFEPMADRPTPDETVRRGTAAQQKLDDPMFNIVARSLSKSYLAEMAATEPQESRKRDWLHTKHQVLQDVLLELEMIRIEGVQTEEEMRKAVEREELEAAAAQEVASAQETNEYAGFGMGHLAQ